MLPLVITGSIIQTLEELKEYAERNPFSMDDLLDLMNGEGVKAGDMKEYTRDIPIGYKVVFSIENQNHKVRHASISVAMPGVLPSIPAVAEILVLLGFEKQITQNAIRMENIGPNHQAVNVWEIVD